MKAKEQILALARENNGSVTTKMVTERGIPRGSLKHLLDSGQLERVERGVYCLPQLWDDEMFNLQSRFSRGVYSCETALYLWNLSDRVPLRYRMTFPKGYNLKQPKQEDIRCIQNDRALYGSGIVQVCTPGGHMVSCYCMERTLCDILRPRMKVDVQIITDAFKFYIQRKDKNIPLLCEYARLLKVQNKVDAYLEVLL